MREVGEQPHVPNAYGYHWLALGHEARESDTKERVWLMADRVRVVERVDHYEVTAPGLHQPVCIEAEEMLRAAAGAVNLISARLYDARRRQDLTLAEDQVDERLAVMLATGLKLGAA